MQNEEPLTPAERELKAALQGLRPAAPAIDRDRLMFLAGRASLRRRYHGWQGVAGMFAAALAISLLIRPAPRQVDRFVYVHGGSLDSRRSVPMPAALPPSLPGDAQGEAAYLRLRDDVLVRGVDALPAGSVQSAAMAEPAPRLEQLLDTSTYRPPKWGFFGLEKLMTVGDRL